MYTFSANRRTAQWKEEGLVTRCTLLKSTGKKGELGWTPAYKLALLQYVETRENF